MDFFSLVAGKMIAESSGNSGGNVGAKLNIAYGDTAPADTSKLWIKANEPKNITFSKDFGGFEDIEIVGNLPTACYGMGCARVGNKVYLFGGYTNGSCSDTISMFDIETKTITVLDTVLPEVCQNMSCVAVGNKIYLLGGYTGSAYLNTIQVFDTKTHTISMLDTTLPTACYFMSCASIDTKIYLIGGIAEGTRNYLKTIVVFDTETQSIATLDAKLNFSGYGMGCAGVGKKIYLFGYYYYMTGVYYTADIYEFDSETQTLTQLSTKLSVSRSHISCASIGNKIYLFGGKNKNNSNVIEVFDTETQSISTLETTLPNTTYNMGCTSIGNQIYLFGGASSIDTINRFTATHDLAENNIEVITAYKNFFNAINSNSMKLEIGVDSVLIGNAENQATTCEAYLHNGTDWQQI